MRDFDRELERVRHVYRSRAADRAVARMYAPLSPAAMFTIQEREWALARLLRASGLMTLSGLDILDVGCGSGGELQRLTTMGADMGRLAGVDLMEEDRIALARDRLPGARFSVASAHQLPFDDGSFDIVSQYTVFSSVLDADLRQAIADEMRRVLRPTGRILWYDMCRIRPTTDLLPIRMEQLERLFSGWTISSLPTTLRWTWVHRVVPRSRLAGNFLVRVPRLCSHVAALIRPTTPA